jgi:hypothetical protein
MISSLWKILLLNKSGYRMVDIDLEFQFMNTLLHHGLSVMANSQCHFKSSVETWLVGQ